jgi:hypothetical protein
VTKTTTPGVLDETVLRQRLDLQLKLSHPDINALKDDGKEFGEHCNKPICQVLEVWLDANGSEHGVDVVCCFLIGYLNE